MLRTVCANKASLFLLAAILLVSGPTLVQSQTVTAWSQFAFSGAWDVPGNWQTGQVPNTTGQSPQFTRAGNYEALLPAGVTSVADLIVGGPSGASLTLRATGATDSTLSLSGDLTASQSNFTIGGSSGNSTIDALGELSVADGARLLVHEQGRLVATTTSLKPGTSLRSTGLTIRGTGSASLGSLSFETVASPSALRQATLTVEGEATVETDEIAIHASGSLNRSNSLQLVGGSVTQSALSGATIGGNAADGTAVLALFSGASLVAGSAGVTLDLNGQLSLRDSLLTTSGALSLRAGSEATLRDAELTASQFDFLGGEWKLELGTNTFNGPATINGTELDISGASTVQFSGHVDHQAGLISLEAGTTLRFGGGYQGSGATGLGQVIFEQGSVEPAADDVGRLGLDGDVQLADDATLAIEIGGLAAATQHDQLQTGAVVELGGTLAVTLVDLNSGWIPSAGQSFAVVSATGGLVGDFDTLQLPSLAAGLGWEAEKTASTYELYIVADSLAGDYNGDGTVDAADYTIWRATLGSTSDLRADGDQSSVVDEGDFRVWRSQFGSTASAATQRLVAVPEPTTFVLLLGFAVLGWRRR